MRRLSAYFVHTFPMVIHCLPPPSLPAPKTSHNALPASRRPPVPSLRLPHTSNHRHVLSYRERLLKPDTRLSGDGSGDEIDVGDAGGNLVIGAGGVRGGI